MLCVMMEVIRLVWPRSVVYEEDEEHQMIWFGDSPRGGWIWFGGARGHAGLITLDQRYGESEAEFSDVIGTKVLRVFLHAIHSHLLRTPPPRTKVV